MPQTPPPLPRILEVKRTLAGREKRFECGVLERRGTHLVVLFVAPEAMHVHGVDLPAGTVTFGHFWSDRPYNVYHWLRRADGATIGHYINLSDETRIDADQLAWLDLIVDVLLLPGAAPRLLDEDEIPADASPGLRACIAHAAAAVLADVPGLLVELEGHRRALWPTVVGRLVDE